MMRLMVSVASSVWSVERTRWPVSAASRPGSIVSKSRISPTRMMSGSCRNALLSACAIDRHLALVDDRLLIAVQEFDRIFHRHDVRASRLIDVIDERRECGALATAR